MNFKRRKILKCSSAASIGLVTADLLGARPAYPRNKSLFQSRYFEEVLSSVLNGDDKTTPSRDIVVKAPGLAEGLIFDVTVSSGLPEIDRIVLLVENKEFQFPLVADYSLLKGAVSEIATRVQVNLTGSRVFRWLAIVYSKGIAYSGSAQTIVVINTVDGDI